MIQMFSRPCSKRWISVRTMNLIRLIPWDSQRSRANSISFKSINHCSVLLSGLCLSNSAIWSLFFSVLLDISVQYPLASKLPVRRTSRYPRARIDGQSSEIVRLISNLRVFEHRCPREMSQCSFSSDAYDLPISESIQGYFG